MKLSPAPLMTLANSVERQSERRFNPDRFNGPANFHEVRACVSADAAQAINNQVAFLARSLNLRFFRVVDHCRRGMGVQITGHRAL